MNEIENNSAEKNNTLKRKIELDSEDELIRQYIFEKKKKSPEPESKNKNEKEFILDNEQTNQNQEKENVNVKTPDTESKKETTKFFGKNKLVQGKLTFKTLEQKSLNYKKEEEAKVIDDNITENIIETEISSDEFKIENYLKDPEWKKLLQDEFNKKYFIEINQKIKPGYDKGINRPPKELVFNALNTTKLNDIKVVVIGQDPYHDDGQAHGLSFSVPVGKALPPSLRNIFTELKSDIPDFKRDEKLGGCLQKWAERGVFLLNAFLTVEAHKAGSHSKFGWDIFTDKVIKVISEKNSGCAFMLWGNFAQKKESLIDKKKHKVLKCAHPSPFSVTRFYGSKCFSQANEYLKSIGKDPIDWNLI